MIKGGTENGHDYWRNEANSYGIWHDGDSGEYEDWVFGPLQSCKIAYPSISLKIQKVERKN